MSALPLSLGGYSAATGLLEPFAPMLLRRRAARGKEEAARLHERLGRPTCPRPDRPVVWLHGVSVGESLSLLPVVEGLGARRPDLALLVTSGTTTAAALLAQRLPAGVIHQYAPIDGPAAVARFLDHWRPALGVLAESDLWPNLILAAKARGTKLALISAHMTKASAARWARTPKAAQALMAAFDLVLPQDGESEGRLRAMGACTGPHLNLKLVGAPLACDETELGRMRAALDGRPVVLAASTHPGEEPLIAQAFRSAGLPHTLLIVAPRHPDRGEAVAAGLAHQGFTVARRGAGEPVGPATTAYVADTLGELGLFLRLASVAVMGGGFVDGIGGHNPLEPARLSVPILAGPHVFKARALYDDLRNEVAAIEASDSLALARHLRGLMGSPMIARRMGEAGAAYARRQGAALDQALDLITPLLPTAPVAA